MIRCLVENVPKIQTDQLTWFPSESGTKTICLNDELNQENFLKISIMYELQNMLESIVFYYSVY